MSESKEEGKISEELKETVQVGTKIFLFPRLKYETDKSYFIRRDFFTNVSPKTQKDYLNALTMSMVWANMKLLKCVYNTDVVENINKMMKT